MPELKHNFIKGRMNLDLDERLVPDGEYRKAMNIEVSTSEGSNVGTIQSVLGNIPASSVNPASAGGQVVGSVVNTGTDKIYYLISTPNKDLIVEHSNNTDVPVVVDVYNVKHTLSQSTVQIAQSNITNNSIIISNTNNNQNIRTDMFLDVVLNTTAFGFFAPMTITLNENEGTIVDTATGALISDFGPVVVWNVTSPSSTELEVHFQTKSGQPFPAFVLTILGAGTQLTFRSKRVLNFNVGNFVTGINVIDDMLFWTDNISEPKKISIQRSKDGIWNGWDGHSKFIAYNSDGVLIWDKYMLEEHITVVKISPLTPPSLEMYNDVGGRGVIFGVTGAVNFAESVLTDPGNPQSVTNIQPFAPGTLVEIPGSFGFFPGDPDFIEGDILMLSSQQDLIDNPRVFPTYEIRVVVVSKTNTSLTVKIIAFKNSFFPYSVDISTGLPNQVWAICLEQSKALFEFKFPRFAYRYKYQDGEYSAFSPFSEVAFIPGVFSYDSKNAYNLGMVNQLRFLKILDFVPDGIPRGVIEIDILYKESNSPNVYTVKTVQHNDPEWQAYGHTTPQSPWQGQTKGAIQLESEVIYAAVPSNQLLRPWDNVPRKARAQEVSANRIIYGNYVEGYDLGMSDNINILTYIKSKDLSNYLTRSSKENEVNKNMGGPSIKSLRTYQVGIVYKDEFGRETPVFTSEKASFNISKTLSDNNNTLFVQNKSNVPSWVDSYKFFIKETSNEYYNLALDRWYNAEDGGIWLSFPSAERNKIDEETYLILKKQHDTEVFVEEEARYKVIAIENEAPDYIKLKRSSVDTQGLANTQTFIAASNSIVGTAALNKVTVGKQGLVIRLFNASDSTDWFPIKSILNLDSQTNPIVNLNGTFEIDVTAEVFGGIVTATAVHSWEIAEEVYQSKPEFQGRFFVKIAEDGVLINSIDTMEKSSQTFTIKNSSKQYYIKSNSKDNTWCQKQAWYGYSTSWSETGGPKFFIDEIERNWGSIPGGAGPWANDNGKGISGSRSGARKNHMELSLSKIKDTTDEGFQLGSHDKAQRQFYNAMHSVNKWIRWKEDPNGIIYQITRSIGQGDGSYGHGSGIYNYDGSNAGKVRKWKTNKTSRLYIKLKATGWRKNGSGEYEEDQEIRGMEPTWISSDIHDSATSSTTIVGWTDQYPGNPTNNWSPTTDTSGVSIEQPSNNSDDGFMGSPNSSNNTNSSGTNVIGSGPGDMKVNTQIGTGFFNTIEVVEKYDIDALKEMSENPAIFETEPKEDIGLDIYYEMDQAFPAEINGKSNENFAKIGSTVQTDFPDSFIKTWKDVGSTAGWTADITQGSNIVIVNSPNLTRYDLIGSKVSSGGFVPTTPLGQSPANSLVPAYFPQFALDPSGVPTTTPVELLVESIDNYNITLSLEATATATNVPIVFTRVSLPKIKHWSDNILTLDCKVVGPQTQTGLGYYADNVALPIAMGADFNSLIFNRLDGGTISGGIFEDLNNPVPSLAFNGVDTNPNGFMELIMRRNTSNAKIDLNWFNCYSFGNGVESDRVRDDYNAVRIDKGVKASTTLSVKYMEERKKHSLIYSGIYNNASGVNNTNQFIMAEKITKDLNPRHGSIQKLHAREGDLITLCEDKVFKILANKDALFNADGNPQMIATTKVLGQATPMGGEYGISKNPESFASQAYKSYFSDKARGVVLKLDGQGLVPISDHGMKDYFADNLPNSADIIGSYDDKKDSYNITITGSENTTVSFGEKTNGWTSFKSFMQEGGVSLNNRYYTFKNGRMWRHHQSSTARFYGARTNPSVNVLFNQLPGSVKSFGSLNYEGSQSRITQNIVDGEYNNNLASAGWFVSRGNTDLQQTDVLEFKSKENKWFSRIKGEAYSANNVDLSEFSFQGIDIASSIVENNTIINGCTDIAALNYDPLATNDDGSCCFDYGCTDSQIGFYPATNGLDRFGNLCAFPCQDNTGAPIGFAAADYNPKFDCCPPTGPCCNYPANIYGCTDPLAANYYAAASFDDGTCCYGGCMDPLATNYNSLACTDDGSCIYNTPCQQGTVGGEAQVGTGMYPNIQYQGTSGDFSNSNHATITGDDLINNNITVGCEIENTYLPIGTTITSIVPSANQSTSGNYAVYLSNVFNNAPTPIFQLNNNLPQNDYLDFNYTCGTCNSYNLKVRDLGDLDIQGAVSNGYTVTENDLGMFQVGSQTPNVAYLLITGDQGNTIKNSYFEIQGAQISSQFPPTYAGGSLPSEVAFVKFENSDNLVYLNYTDPNGTDPNPNYDPLFVPGPTNTVVVIVALYPFVMPNNDLDLAIDIDGDANVIGSVVNNITLT